jgi:hypothetical protein
MKGRIIMFVLGNRHSKFYKFDQNMKKSAKREGRVNFWSAWRPAGMSRHNQQRSVEEGRSLLGGTYAMKSVKPSVDILEGLSTGFNMDVSVTATVSISTTKIWYLNPIENGTKNLTI